MRGRREERALRGGGAVRREWRVGSGTREGSEGRAGSWAAVGGGAESVTFASKIIGCRLSRRRDVTCDQTLITLGSLFTPEAEDVRLGCALKK